MLVHNVFFSLRKDLSDSEIKDFETGLSSLKAISHADSVYIGSPAPVAERPVLDRDYDFCLTVLLKDVEAHNAYQADPIHQAFIGGNKEKWTQVRVFDAS